MEQDNLLNDAEKGQVRNELIALRHFADGWMHHQAGPTTTMNTIDPSLDQNSRTDAKVLFVLFLSRLDFIETSMSRACMRYTAVQAMSPKGSK
jgi:hypothetical protein